MDPAVKYLQELGYTNAQIHGTKALNKIEFIAKHFGLGKVPKINKKHANHILLKFLNGDRSRNSLMPILKETLNIALNPYKQDYHALTISNLPSAKFYKSKEWRELRYKILEKQGNKCKACGVGPKTHGIPVHVDHILPRSIYPEHALNPENLQVLCEDCNLGKSNKYEKDWR